MVLPNGHEIHGYLRCIGRDYAMVFALLEDGTVPLVRQHKHGVGQALLDLPAGYLDVGEDPLAAAQRELREETGIIASEWRSIGSLIVDANRGRASAYLFVAMGAKRVAEQALDASEIIEVTCHTPETLREMVLSGEIRSLATVAGIMTALHVL